MKQLLAQSRASWSVSGSTPAASHALRARSGEGLRCGGHVAKIPLKNLVALAKLRWRIEHDYRELKDALGLDHFEGRTYPGWNHHVTHVAVAHAFRTLERRRRPPTRAAA